MRWAFPARAPVRHAQIPATWSSIHFKHLKHQSLTRACNRGCEPTNQPTNERRARVQFVESPQSRVQRTPNRSRNAPTTTSHHIFDAYRRDPSETLG